MRRRDREITNPEEILNIIRRCEVCHVAFHSEEFPYVVPLNFGVDLRGKQLSLFFHGAPEGRKMGLLHRDPRVAFVMETTRGISGAKENIACYCSMFYESVMGEGLLSLLSGEEKLPALQCLLKRHYGEAAASLSFNPHILQHTAGLRLDVIKLSAKRHLPAADHTNLYSPVEKRDSF